MHSGPSPEPRRDSQPPRLAIPRERRRSVRIPLQRAVKVHDPSRHLGHYWTRDLSYEGLFLLADRTARLTSTILLLHFDTDGQPFCLRGATVRVVPDQGAGIQLAYWRRGDDRAHAAYRQLIDRHTAGTACPL